MMRLAKILTIVMILLSAARTEERILSDRKDLPDSALTELLVLAETEIAILQRKIARKPSLRAQSSSPLYARNRVRVVLLQERRSVSSGEAEGISLQANTRAAAGLALKRLSTPLTGERELHCLIEVFLPDLPLSLANPLDLPRSIDSGREGFRIRFGAVERMVSASEQILSGLTGNVLFNKALLELGIDGTNLLSPEVAFFRCPSVMMVRDETGKALRLFRNGTLFPLIKVTPSALLGAIQATEAWFKENQNEDGLWPQRYSPVWDQTSPESGQREFLQQALFGLGARGALYAVTGGEITREAEGRGLSGILSRSYREDAASGIGYLQEGSQVELGTAAAALLAIIRCGELKTYTLQAEQLAKFLLSMRREDGSYKTILPENRNRRNDEIGSGQAQVALLEWMKASGNQQALTAVQKSFDYYREIFGQQHSIALIPWHTQACTLLYQRTKEPPLVEFIFAMTDVMAGIQQKGAELPADLQGRFFEPEKRVTGYPNINVTSLALEGMADALFFAREWNDTVRIKRYRDALVKGLRYLLQMQIRYPEDTWCMPSAKKAAGGFRSREDSPVIRLENQYYAAMALIKVQKVLNTKDIEAVLADP